MNDTKLDLKITYFTYYSNVFSVKKKNQNSIESQNAMKI